MCITVYMEHETTYLIFQRVLYNPVLLFLFTSVMCITVYMEHETTYLIFKRVLYNPVLLFLFFQFILNFLFWTALLCSKSSNFFNLYILLFNILHRLSIVVPSGIVPGV